MNWLALFRLGVDPLELFIRGTAIYWFLFLLFRFVLRRDVGSMAIADVLLVVLIADAAQNGMAGGYETVTDGMLLVATLAGWNYLLDWASFHSPALRRLMEAQPLPLIKQGKLLRKNMRRELVTFDELQSKLREAGIEHVAQVRLAMLESDGNISVIKEQADDDSHGGPSRIPL